MTDAIDRRILVQRAEALRRLADRASAAGVDIFVLDPRTGAHIATDPDHPIRVFRVDAAGCACRCFTIWGRCGHRALLLSQLGLIPDAGSVPCPVCRGRGWGEPQPVPGTAAYTVTCRACDGRGWVPPATIVVGGERRPAAVLAAA